ncbi:MAG: UDP-glucose 4-epimerase GalE [Gammaproteobacteria bacterium]|nr:UDP-glucose 4-epimerase GalE [Gammaproteobacteria bacterium]
MWVLVTGGAGFIGTHTCIELLENGYNVIVIDNLSNSSKISLDRVRKITGNSIEFFHDDVRDKDALNKIFTNYDVGAVIHFAGLKAVGESVAKPLEYYDNNIGGTINLCQVMDAFNVKNIVFSSSATVYGEPDVVPIKENFPLAVTNPYGRSKLIIEEILHDLHVSDKDWNIALLRYFNPIGAHESGLFGEDPMGTPNNIMPYITQVGIGILDKLKIFGNDYDTIDGTGMRDYIHVVDLAKGHVAAIKAMGSFDDIITVNLGTGSGYTVLELVNAFEVTTGIKIPYEFVERRPGDIARCYADVSLAKELLGWASEKTLNDMCRDSWNWQSKNPNGYE